MDRKFYYALKLRSECHPVYPVPGVPRSRVAGFGGRPMKLLIAGDETQAAEAHPGAGASPMSLNQRNLEQMF